MHAASAPLLEQHAIFHGREPNRCALSSAARTSIWRLPRGSLVDLDVRINGIYLPGMYLGYIQYGPPVEVRAVQRDDYWIQLPIRGQLQVVSGKASVTCDARRAGIASPTRQDYYLVRSNSGCAGIRLSLFQHALSEQLAVLLGEPPRAALDFAPDIDLTCGYGRSLAAYLRMVVADLEHGDSLLGRPLATSVLEDFIMNALLLSQPHNYSEALRRLEKPIAPRDVKRAIDYIHANLDAPLTIGDITGATGVAGRTLFMHFKVCNGMSPMRYVRNLRFERVRQALLRAEAEDSVTRIAMSCGFSHMGRFAVEYRQRFGERPSQTLKHRHGRAGTAGRSGSPRRDRD